MSINNNYLRFELTHYIREYKNVVIIDADNEYENLKSHNVTLTKFIKAGQQKTTK